MLASIVWKFVWPEYWNVDHQNRIVELSGSNHAELSLRMDDTLKIQKEKDTFGILRRWKGEDCDIYGPSRCVLLTMESTGVPLFGAVSYGIQLLAYQEVGVDDYKIWIAKRAQTKRTFPGMFDSTVGGSICAGEKPFACAVRGAEEEASISSALTLRAAKACGIISYIYRADSKSNSEVGLIQPEIQYLYEMKIEEDIKPIPNDGEVDEFYLLDTSELKIALAEERFSPTVACVILSFFVRHGILTPENEPDYIEIVSRLNRRLFLHTA